MRQAISDEELVNTVSVALLDGMSYNALLMWLRGSGRTKICNNRLRRVWLEQGGRLLNGGGAVRAH